MDCADKNKECCTKNSESINWSNKVLKMDHHLRSEVGIEATNDIEDILLSIQIKGSETLEPAFISSEDDVFLDIFVLGSNGLKPTAVLKKDIQSIGVMGGKMPDKDEDIESKMIQEMESKNTNESSKDHFLKMYC